MYQARYIIKEDIHMTQMLPKGQTPLTEAEAQEAEQQMLRKYYVDNVNAICNELLAFKETLERDRAARNVVAK